MNGKRATALIILTLFISTITWSQGSYTFQPQIDARMTELLHQDGMVFKDLNKNGKLDIYEDWRKPVSTRVNDLVSQMTPEEKAGMLLINTMNADTKGRLPEIANRYIFQENMTRFIFRNNVAERTANNRSERRGGGFRRTEPISPYEAAQFMNSVQELAESTRLGIPVLFKSNGRNHYTHSAQLGIDVSAGSFSAFPKEAGLAAAALGEGNMDVIKTFSKIMAMEWSSIGLRGMYGYMADLCTEPRWNRFSGCFTEDADLNSEIMATLVTYLQRKDVWHNNVYLTMKHFPGGGPQLDGFDAHYRYGKDQVYPANMFDYHWKPFKAAIDAGLSAIMPYYGVPVGGPYKPNDVGMSYSKGIVTDLLRVKLGFKGVVNSDTGIMQNMPWGVEDKSIDERVVMSVNAGVDVLSGFDNNAQVLGMIGNGITEERIDESCKRMLTVQFELGLFENPYVDPVRASTVVGRTTHTQAAFEAQKKSIVLLQNKDILPLPAPTKENPITILTMGMNADILSKYSNAQDEGGFGFGRRGRDETPTYTVVDGNDSTLNISTVDADYAIIRVTARYSGGTVWFVPWDQQNPGNGYGMLSLSSMDETDWELSPSLTDIQTAMKQVGAKNTIISIYFSQPFVLDEQCGIRNAGAILATFGVRDDALLQVLTGAFNPQGKMPFALAKSQAAIEAQDEDAPGYPEKDTLFPFGFGLSYK